jgi:hypothetical protein
VAGAEPRSRPRCATIDGRPGMRAGRRWAGRQLGRRAGAGAGAWRKAPDEQRDTRVARSPGWASVPARRSSACGTPSNSRGWSRACLHRWFPASHDGADADRPVLGGPARLQRPSHRAPPARPGAPAPRGAARAPRSHGRHVAQGSPARRRRGPGAPRPAVAPTPRPPQPAATRARRCSPPTRRRRPGTASWQRTASCLPGPAAPPRHAAARRAPLPPPPARVRRRQHPPGQGARRRPRQGGVGRAGGTAGARGLPSPAGRSLPVSRRPSGRRGAGAPPGPRALVVRLARAGRAGRLLALARPPGPPQRERQRLAGAVARGGPRQLVAGHRGAAGIGRARRSGCRDRPRAGGKAWRVGGCQRPPPPPVPRATRPDRPATRARQPATRAR